MRAARLVASVSITLLWLPVVSLATDTDRNVPADIGEVPLVVPSLYIVEAGSVDASRQSVEGVAASVRQQLEIVNAVSAYLTVDQADRLRRSGVRLFADRTISTRGGLGSLLGSLTSPIVSTVGNVAAPIASPVLNVAAPLTTPLTQIAAPVTSAVLSVATPLAGSTVSPLASPLMTSISSSQTLQDGTSVGSSSLFYETNYPMLVGADSLHNAGITGQGVTIAVLDSGLWQDPSQNYGGRILATLDVVNGGSGPVSGDAYGHGTHVTSIAAGGAQDLALSYDSIAPHANLVIVRAFDGQGGGRYTDVIAGLNWIVANRAKYKIRVLNLSFGAQPQSYYWDDPLDQAVMAAWRAGIVVVAAAGNEGPNAMTIDVPGNVPYVITTGALTDNYTPYDATDDRLASFSSAGPTFEGFVKPEMVGPGGHIAASMPRNSYLANIDPDSMSPGEQLFTMSGTSMSAAVTTGVVALMLQADPSLTPDEVKCRLLASSRPAVTSSNTLAYSVFQQGAGLINATSAVNSSATGCANLGLDVNADLAGTQHFGGPANQDANGNYYIMNMGGSAWGTPTGGDGLSWNQGYTWARGYSWSQTYTWSQGYTWARGYTWAKGYTWARGYTWAKGYTWARGVPWWNTSQAAGAAATTPASIESWVPNE